MRPILTIFLCANLSAATYYVSPSGSSSGDGSEGNPWGNIVHAQSSLAAGDTVLVADGVYKHSTYFNTSAAGAEGNPITIRAVNARMATNHFGHLIDQPWYVIDGIVVDKSGMGTTNLYANVYPFFVHRPGDNLSVTNCTFVNNGNLFMNDPGAGGAPTDAASGLNVQNNIFQDGLGTTYLNVQGTDHLFEGNFFRDAGSSDAIRCFGSNIVFRANTFTNLYAAEGVGNHPDIFQTFGDNGFWMNNVIFERNLIIDCPIQLCQMVQTQVKDFDLWGMVFRNNVIINCDAAGSVNIPNVKFFNNTFYQVKQGGNSGLQFGFYDTNEISNPNWRGWAQNCEVKNNAFIDSYNTSFPGYTVAAVTTNSSGGFTVAYSDPTATLDADYNYVSYPGYTAKTSFSEANGINGGDPDLVSTDLLKPTLGSIFIDAGTTVDVDDDYQGAVRPQGSGMDIGAFEFDESLKLHFDFDQNDDFSGGVVTDITGHGNHGYQFNPTNWITLTNGTFGGSAASFITNFTMTNGPNVYPASQYIAVTNLTGIDRMTNATFSFWAKFNHKTGQNITYLIDAGFNLSGAKGGRANATNGFRIGRLIAPTVSRMSMNVFQATTSSSDGDQINYWPVDTVNGTTDTTTEDFNLYTITIDCDAGQSVVYHNGQATRTNSLTIPWLRVYAWPYPWLCIGANHHDGTYEWGDDLFPNDCYHYGWLDDLRIYNRTLSADEVAAIYEGRSAFGIASEGGGGEEPPASDHSPRRNRKHRGTALIGSGIFF